ncbi:uncharacterized protein LOC114194099 isoform X1 [Vigna unguiculata]|uniref:uncharacterized protein LOC114194099 isoform X1 n=1 Tax=Vigna unguiculata TaxID=3917 RepID=UPI001016AD83|nr:uncharacterized protein LOC114194099 isoform X1 [Vigna unguiculata]
MGAKDCFKSNIYDIVHDSNKRIAKRRVWKLSDYDMFFCRMLITMEEILTAEFLETMEFFVLDSLGHGRKKRTKIDNNVDGHPKFNGNCMPQYTTEDLQQIRQNFICEWILHEDNQNRDEVLQHYDLYLRQ